MSGIVEFVLARIGEREVDAECWHHWLDCDYAQVAFYGPSSSCECNGKAWVLADCEAKRRIVGLHRKCGTGHGYCDDGGHGWGDGLPLGCADLAYLASVDADHPDFDEAWRV